MPEDEVENDGVTQMRRRMLASIYNPAVSVYVCVCVREKERVCMFAASHPDKLHCLLLP